MINIKWCCNTLLSQQVDISGAVMFSTEARNHLSRATKLLSATSCWAPLPSAWQQLKQTRVEENSIPTGGLAHVLAASQKTNLVMVSTRQKNLAKMNLATLTECLIRNTAALAAGNAWVCCWWWTVAVMWRMICSVWWKSSKRRWRD